MADLPYQSKTQCPHCGQCSPQAVTFTWWGGLLGPKMFHHVKCGQCRKTYNAKTGKSNDTAIVIYLVVSGVIAFAILGLLACGGLFTAFRF